jgi:hypothetical protein
MCREEFGVDVRDGIDSGVERILDISVLVV